MISNYLFFACVLSFFLGAIPFGYLLGRMRGVDLRTVGSGNTGATNAARALGKKAGVITLLLDVLKGVIPVLCAKTFFASEVEEFHMSASAATGVAALFGHCFSPFLKFRGGKGVATGLGVFITLSPAAGAITLAVFAVTIGSTKFVSLASIVAAASLPISIAAIYGMKYQTLVIAACVSSSLIILRHRSNIRRLLDGSEPKFPAKSKDTNENEAAKC